MSRNRNSFSMDDFPLLEGTSTYPSGELICPGCGSKRVGEPHQGVALIGGGMLMDRRTRSGGPSEQLDGFLDLEWHPVEEWGSLAKESELSPGTPGFLLPLAQRVRGGQFGFFFCSVSCLRGFLNELLDFMENTIQSNQGAKKES